MNRFNLFSVFWLVCRRDFLLLQRQQSSWLNPMLFYCLIALLFGLSFSHDPKILEVIGPGVIWVGCLLASYVSLDAMFREDFEDGTIEQWLLDPETAFSIVFARLTSHWLVSGVSLLTCTPLIGLMYHLSGQAVLVIMLGLFFGTFVMTYMGAVGIALTVSLDRGGVLLAIIVLPLYIPVLIVGNMMALAGTQGQGISGFVALLGALTVFSGLIAPWATLAALRLALK